MAHAMAQAAETLFKEKLPSVPMSISRFKESSEKAVGNGSSIV